MQLEDSGWQHSTKPPGQGSDISLANFLLGGLGIRLRPRWMHCACAVEATAKRSAMRAVNLAIVEGVGLEVMGIEKSVNEELDF